MDIAILGPRGTFSDKAYLQYKKGNELNPIYCPTIDEVFERVLDGCDYGIVPIENTLDGYVLKTLDLLLQKNVHIIDENIVPVQFSLLGNADSLDDIKELYVQFKASGQCCDFINTLSDTKIISTESNMESYYNMGTKENVAAIVPLHVALEEKEKKRVKLIIDNVTDSDSNYTRFIIIKKNEISIENDIERSARSNTESSAGNNTRNSTENSDVSADEPVTGNTKKIRIPVYIMPNTDRSGVLFEILKDFYEKNINLISILSRPTKKEMGTYIFYLEIDGDNSQLDDIIESFKEIKKQNDIKILGIYEENSERSEWYFGIKSGR